MGTDRFCDLVKRIEEYFTEIDSDILVDLRKWDEEYLSFCEQLGNMKRDYPFIMDVLEESGEISLTEQGHKVLVDYLRLALKKDNTERRQIYFRGHTDGYAYLKKIDVV